MLKIFEYFKGKKPNPASKEEKQVPVKDEEKYPAKNDIQAEYRKEFGNIVDQFLIAYYSERDEKHPDGYHHIVYIGADDNLYWTSGGGSNEEEAGNNDPNSNKENSHYFNIVNNSRYLESTSRLRSLLYAPTPNLSRDDILTYRKMIGMGCKAALNGNWSEVESAIRMARNFRDERNKEFSRYTLMRAATKFLAILVVLYIVYLCIAPYAFDVKECLSFQTIPYVSVITGIVMGAVGAYVSICTGYSKKNMSGLGEKKIYYFEAFTRMLIGAILALIVIFGLKGKLFLGNIPIDIGALYLFSIIGFCAGFSEKWVPSLLVQFIGKEDNAVLFEDGEKTKNSQREKSVN